LHFFAKNDRPLNRNAIAKIIFSLEAKVARNPLAVLSGRLAGRCRVEVSDARVESHANS
jgi:hypothetical protein